jgi:hypothetical protein
MIIGLITFKLIYISSENVRGQTHPERPGSVGKPLPETEHAGSARTQNDFIFSGHYS